MSPFGEEFRRLRTELGLTQLEAAQRLGYNRTNTVSDWERGVAKVTPDEAARYLAQLQQPRVETPSEYARGFADAVARMRGLLEGLAASPERSEIEGVADAMDRASTPEVATRPRARKAR